MKVKILIVFSALLFSAVVFAGGVLVDEWEGDIYKYCKYSDGTVIKIGLVSLCPPIL